MFTRVTYKVVKGSGQYDVIMRGEHDKTLPRVKKFCEPGFEVKKLEVIKTDKKDTA